MSITATAVVNFRTLPNGGYRYMRGLRRGWYRLLDVQDKRGSMMITSRNVIRQIARTADGIEGVTPRSSYYLGYAADNLYARASRINAARDAEFNVAVHHAE